MKNKIKKIIGIGFIFLIIGGFTIYQSSLVGQRKNDIIGIWISKSTPEWKLEFKTDGKCYDYYQGVLDETYSYIITEETADNGVAFSFLKLVNVNDANDIYEYEINGITESEMYLDYLGDLKAKLSRFIKQ